MLRKSLCMVILSVALMAVGCATTAPYVPFKVPQEEFYNKTRTIALAPINVPECVENKDVLKDKFESRIEAKLREAGFLVVPAQEYDAIWKKMTGEVGGFFDPVTGKRDQAKYKSAEEHTLREISTTHRADAVLYAGFQTLSAPWAYNKATWHGASDSMTPEGKSSLGIFGGPGGSYGKVPALSLYVVIKDTNGVSQYVNWGGIQVLSKYSRGQFIPVPDNELLMSDERNAAAVNIAMDPLFKKTESPEGARGEKEKKKEKKKE